MFCRCRCLNTCCGPRRSLFSMTQRPNHRLSADPYIIERQARSVLCVPLLNRPTYRCALSREQSRPSVFAPGRIAVLKLLASQAAIALENTRLYGDLAEREAKIRRLVDANIIGIFTWHIPRDASDDEQRILSRGQ